MLYQTYEISLISFRLVLEDTVGGVSDEDKGELARQCPSFLRKTKGCYFFSLIIKCLFFSLLLVPVV